MGRSGVILIVIGGDIDSEKGYALVCVVLRVLKSISENILGRLGVFLTVNGGDIGMCCVGSLEKHFGAHFWGVQGWF